MAQYPIPQFIEAEGKIISFLTFHQFFWLVGGLAVCILFYYILPFFLFVFLSLLVVLFIVLVAFVKVDNMSVMTLFLNYIMFSTKSKDYVWKKKQSSYPFKTKNTINASTANPADSKLNNVKGMVEYRKKV